MSDPLQRAKPVGPPPSSSGAPSSSSGARPQSPAGAAGPSAGPTAGAEQQAGQGQAGQQTSFAPPYVRAYTWSSSGRRFPWLAILLVALGIGLLVELLVPELTFFSLILLAAGAAFAVAAVVGRVIGATIPALVLIAWALARMASELGYVSGDGWSSLFVGGAFLIGWGLGRFQHARREWALWLGLILGVIGLADVSDTLPFDLDMAIVIPLAMIAVGLYLIARQRMPARSR